MQVLFCQVLVKLKSKQSINRISVIDQLCVKLLILPLKCVTSPPNTHLVVIVVIVFRWLHRVFAQHWCVHQCIVFLGNFSCFHFSMSLKAFKRWQARIGLSFATVYIKKIIFIIKLGFHKGKCLLMIIWLCLWFSSIFFGEISQNFHKLWKLSWQSFKSWKKIGWEKKFSCYLEFCVFFLYLKFGPMNFFYWQALRRTQICSTVQQILGNSTKGNMINFTWKIPIFFVTKHYVME